MQNSTIQKNNKRLLTLIFWLLVWQAIYMSIGKDVLFASPINTLKALVKLFTEVQFYKTVLFSFIRISVGFFLGVTVGTMLGILTSIFTPLKILFNPLVSIVRAAPVASFIILALAWIKTGRVPVFIAFLMVVPVVLENICEGIGSVDNKLLEMAKIYGFSFLQKIKKIYIPSIKPYFRSAVITGAGFAFKSGVAAEVIASPAFSIGKELYDSKIYLETAELFAWTALIIILSIAFEKFLIRLLGDDKSGN